MAEIEKELRHYLEGAVEPRAALEWSRETRAAMVDLKFCDLLGTWQHVTLPVAGLDESAFDEGLGFDGSSIRGWQGISESDMLLMPDASTAEFGSALSRLRNLDSASAGRLSLR
jgi:glutamine synthetase